MSFSSGYIRIPRSLLEDPLWLDLNPKCQTLFIKIIELAYYKPRKFDDHGNIVEIQVGQICITQRELMEELGRHFSKNNIHRNLLKLRLCRFLNLEVNHFKTIITITHSDTYELIKLASEPGIEPRLNQDRTRIEPEKNKENKAKKEINKNTQGVRVCVFFDRSLDKFQNVTPEWLKLMKETFPNVDIEQQMREMRLWLRSNPRGKGKEPFIISWLKRSQPEVIPTKTLEEPEVDPYFKNLFNKKQEEPCLTK